MGRWILVVVIFLVPFFSLASYPTRQGSPFAFTNNVILIAVDTLAAQHLGFMGYERDTSPFMDDLASRSVVFNRAYTPKSTTLPAFTSLLSGVHPCHHGVLDNGVEVPPNLHLLTGDFQDAGFRTWAIPAARVIEGKYGLNKGFDFYAYPPAVPYTADRVIDRVDGILNGTERFGEPDYRETKVPVFFMLHFYDPHTEFTPDPDVYQMFSDSLYDGIVDGTWEQFGKYNNYEIEFDQADLAEVTDLYDAEIRSFDRRLEELFQLFDEAGILDNSVIVLTADHGENLGEHRFITHGHPYEAALHIPLMFHFPGDRLAGTRIDELVELTDVIPTLMDIFMMDIPDDIDGRSLLPFIEGTQPPLTASREYLFSIGQPTDAGRMYSLFDGRHRLIVDVDCFGYAKKSDVVPVYTYAEREGNFLLFDIASDPSEAVNLYTGEGCIRAGDIDVLNHLVPELDQEILGSHYGQDPAIDPETIEMLASLGYI